MGSLFSGIHLKWDYDNKHADLSMPGYVHKALDKLEHTTPSKPKHSPSPYTAPTFGSTVQPGMKPREHTLSPEDMKRLQVATGLFLYYGRAVGPTMLHALNELATKTTNGNDDTIRALKHFVSCLSPFSWPHMDHGD